MPIRKSDFIPPWWLSNPHLQTLWPVLFRKKARFPLSLKSEILELPDGDFLELATNNIQEKPIIVILHGLEGSLDSHYIGPLIEILDHKGYGVCFMHFRGCGTKPNRLPRSYHSGETEDLQTLLQHLNEKFQQGVFSTIGFSLGGNVLLKSMGEQKEHALTQSAIAISVPFELSHAGERLEQSFSKVYQKHLLSSCQNSYLEKFSALASPLDVDVKTLNTFFHFDDQVTAPLHGFKDAKEYYEKCSSKSFLKDITKPTLILHAKDDPFMWRHTPPLESDLSDSVILELSDHGGHVGFVSGSPFRIEYWLEKRIVAWLDHF